MKEGEKNDENEWAASFIVQLHAWCHHVGRAPLGTQSAIFRLAIDDVTAM